MSRGRLINPVLLASMTGFFSAGALVAQEPSAGITAGLAFSTQYPDRFQEGCGNPVAIAPSVRAHRRLYRALAAEVSISGLLQVPPGQYCSAGDARPLMDGDIRRLFDPPAGSLSLATEARIILTPVSSTDGALRLIGGGAWYPTRSTPAWILGAGYRPPVSWGAFLFDIERWSVGAAYDLERFRIGAPAEPLGSGREWQSFWQFRAGLTLWSR